MQTIDERIREELTKDDALLDELFPKIALKTFTTGQGRWVVIAISIVLFALLTYCGLRLYIAPTVQESVQWGVCLLVCVAGATTLELWTWMQVNRLAVLRDIKQLELNLRVLISEEKS